MSDRWKLHCGDCLPWLQSLDAGSVDLVLCSPPYERARLYLEDGRDMGVARDTETWVRWLVEVCHAMRHACRGLCVLVVEGQTENFCYSGGPFLLMADLLRAGFCLRKPCVYRRVGVPGGGGNRNQHEANGGGTDWLRNDWEPIICFTRGGKLPWADGTATGRPPKWGAGGAMSHRNAEGTRRNAFGISDTSNRRRSGDGKRETARKVGTKKATFRREDGSKEPQEYEPPAIANPGNVVNETYSYTAAEVARFIGTPTDIVDCAVGGNLMGHPLCHENEAPFPETLAEFFVRSFCPVDGTVCDPFSGSGTTGAVAVRWRRRFIGCDLRPSQVALATRRIQEETPYFEGMV